MKIENLEYLKQTLEYALHDCPVNDGDHETHFNMFANAISVVDDELNLLTTHDGLISFLQEIENDKTYIHNQYYKNRAKTLRERIDQ